MKRLLTLGLACLSTFAISTSAQAEDYPSKPITLSVAYSPGGGNDTVARLMAKHIEPYIGTRVVVENQPGAGGQVGFTRLARAKNDGYTIGLLSAPSIFMIEMLRKGVGYKLEDFQAVANIQSDPIVLAVKKSSDITDFNSFLEKVKANPGAMNIGGDGPQSNVHLQAASLEKSLDLDLNFISYSGSGPATTGLLSDEVEAALLTASSALQFVDSDHIEVLGVFAEDRHPALPDVATIQEMTSTNVPSVGTAIRGIAAPAGITPERLAHLEKAFKELLQDEAFMEAAKNAGIMTTYMDSTSFSQLLNDSKKQSAEYIDLMK